MNNFYFPRFIFVGASGLVVNNLCLVLLTEYGGLHYLFSAIVATQCSTMWNFILTENWVFGKRDQGRKSLGNRLWKFFLMNNTSLLIRGPLMSLMVSELAIHYLLANLVSLGIISLIRFVISDRWIWTPAMGEYQASIFSYDIHGILGIESGIRLPELEYFRVTELQRQPDMRLGQDRRINPRPSDTSIHYDDGLGRFGFALSIAPGDCTEIFVSKLLRYSPHVLYTNVFEPLLRWNFVRKGYALVHAACIADKGKGILITAKTDTGKTSTILRLIDHHGCEFISDDMTILASDGSLLNFPKPLTISSHTLHAVRSSNLNLRERIALQFQSRIHSRSGRTFALWLNRVGVPVASLNAVVQILVPPPKYAINRLIPGVKIAERAKLSHIVLIERGPPHSSKAEIEAIVDTIVTNAEDAYGFPPYSKLAGHICMRNSEDLHTQERQIIIQATNSLPASQLQSETYDWWKQIPQVCNFTS
jgi:dolichol-phosphate mannosyltransferase